MCGMGFKARVDPFTCILCHLRATESSDSPLRQEVSRCRTRGVHTHVRIDDDWRVCRCGVPVAEGRPAALDHSLAARWRTTRQHRVLYTLQASPPLVILTILLHQRRKTLKSQMLSNYLAQVFPSEIFTSIRGSGDEVLKVLRKTFHFFFSGEGVVFRVSKPKF